MGRGPVNRSQLCHVVRAAARVTGLTDLVVIGSQAVLGTHEAGHLPWEATRSAEADVAIDLVIAKVSEAADESALADDVDGAIGEGSEFHREFGYYGQGVETTTATLPDGWRERLVPLVCEGDEPVVGWCLEINDLWISKAAAGRSKDAEFCDALVEADLVDLDEIELRSESLAALDHTRVRQAMARARRPRGQA